MIKAIIDTDPGTDDTLAIMMALNSPDLDIAAVTTVGGNATLADTTRNALRLLDHLDIPQIPVSRGSARPLAGRYPHAYHFHGPAGLGVRLPAPKSKPHPVGAPELITQVASAFPGQSTIIALGPLTNIARALKAEPRLAERVEQIVIMGGAAEVPGNVTPCAEFNFYSDPLAADIVLRSGISATLVGLDVTTRVFFTEGDRPWVAGHSRTALLARRILSNWFGSHPGSGGYHLHDPLAVVAAIRPDLLSYRRANVTVETAHPEQAGRTRAEYGHGPVRVALAVDVDAARALISNLLSGDGP